MNKFEMLHRISDINKFATLVFDTVQNMNSSEEFATLLSEEINEEGLQTIKAAVQRGYPLSLDGIQ